MPGLRLVRRRGRPYQSVEEARRQNRVGARLVLATAAAALCPLLIWLPFYVVRGVKR